jgi:hypothetical protein
MVLCVSQIVQVTTPLPREPILVGKELHKPARLNSLQNKFPHHFGAEDFPDINSLDHDILQLFL